MRKIFLDFDGTIANSTKAFIEVYNKRTDSQVNWENVSEWDFSDQCNKLKNTDISEIFASSDFFEALELYDHQALSAFNKIKEKYEILICSIGTPENLARKALWVKENLNHSDMILLSKTNTSVGKSLVDMQGGIFIDDHEDNLFSSNASKKISFGVRKSWNANWDGLVCLDWGELEKELL